MQQSKKIVMVTPAFAPSLGGVEQHVMEVSRQLIAKGHQVFVITITENQDASKKEIIDGIEVHRIYVSDKTRKIEVWKGIVQLQKIFLTSDVVHIHDVFWWILPLYFQLRKKIFITFHGWEGQYPVRSSTQLQRFIASLLSLGRVHVGDFIAQFYWDTPDLVIYGAPTKIKKKSKKIEKPYSLVFVGRLVQENEVGLYLRYVRELQAQLAVHVIWVGDGPYANQCNQLGKVTGWVSDTSKYIERADLVLANSYLSIFEAFGQGKPIVSLYSHPLKETYLRTFPLASEMILAAQPEEAVAETVRLLNDKETYKKLTSSILKKVARFSWSQIADQYLQLWK